MFPADITLTDKSTVAVTYSQISLVDSKSVRKAAASGAATPKTLIISHTESGKGLSAVDRRLIRINDTYQASTDGSVETQTGSVYLVIEKPRNIVTDAHVNSMLDRLVEFISSTGNRAKILNGEP